VISVEKVLGVCGVREGLLRRYGGGGEILTITDVPGKESKGYWSGVLTKQEQYSFRAATRRAAVRTL